VTAAALEGGGLVPARADVQDPERVDGVSARRYGHAALGDRPVVRLVPDALAPAEDLAMEFLGFAQPAVEGPVAKAARRALGFPAWVLAHDPGNAGHALAVVKEMERLARLAASKPGLARDGFGEIGERLARSVPHFLPTFYEEAGRAYAAHGNAAQAGTMFGRAREAERSFGLAVDEQRRRDAFVEFALAGALTAKALAEYARELAERLSAEQAYRTFRELCVQRTLGGMPPWSGMATELRRLARAADRDAAAEDRAILTELLDSPATARAAAGFWKPYRKALVALAREDAAVRARLLDITPGAEGGSPELDDLWIDVLEASGASAELTGGGEPGRAAAWLSRWVAHIQRRWSRRATPRLLELVRAMAERLRADAVPVALVSSGWRGRADLDLVDLALELELPLADPPRDAMLDLLEWKARDPGERRQLEFVAANGVWGVHLDAELESALGYRVEAGSLLDAAGMRVAVGRWLERRLDASEGGTLARLHGELSRLDAAGADVWRAVPGAGERLAALDVAGVLARTLRGGLLDELGWPALEQAAARLARPQRGAAPALYGAFPDLVVSDGSRAVVVAPDRIVLEHDLRIPRAARDWGRGFEWAGGQLLVRFLDDDDGGRGYWSGRPREVFALGEGAGGAWQFAPFQFSLELPDGGRTIGGRPLHTGDTSVGESAGVLSDGTAYWRLAVDGEARALVEFDPATGRAGRRSLPRFLEDFAAEGWALELETSWVVPIPAVLESTPLGARDGLAGCRMRRRLDDRTRLELESIDGRRLALSVSAGRRLGALTPAALVAWPGDDAPRPLAVDAALLELWAPDDAGPLLHAKAGAIRPPLARGTPLVPPAAAFATRPARARCGHWTTTPRGTCSPPRGRSRRRRASPASCPSRSSRACGGWCASASAT
jgi:hypothetical protein